MKKQRGITLVALIITIIILLILAIVAINAVSGDGIINYAKNATGEYENKTKEEKKILNDYKSFIDDKVLAKVKFGDLNNDGKINATDPNLLSRYLDKLNGVTINKAAADMNRDKILDSSDHEKLKEITFGNDTLTEEFVVDNSSEIVTVFNDGTTDR